MRANFFLATLASVLVDGPDLMDLVAGFTAGNLWQQGQAQFEESDDLHKHILGQILSSPHNKDET